jgi:hypothetical protein
MRIAETLSCTLAECYSKVSSSEANLWAAYFVRQDKEKWAAGSDPMHHYMAALTSRVTSMWGGKSAPTSDFILEFQTGVASKNSDWKQQKSTLLAAFGINPDASD